MQSYISIVNACDTFPATGTRAHAAAVSCLICFRVASHPAQTLGYVLPDVAAAFAADAEPAGGGGGGGGGGAWLLDATDRTLTLTAGTGAATEEQARAARTAAVAATLARMRASRRFAVLDKWRDEQYLVYGAAAEEGDAARPAELLFTVERAAAALLGVVTYGVHMTAFSRAGPGPDGIKVWVARRSRTKQTFPGMLDNSVAGGLSAEELLPDRCLARECAEEASLGADVSRLARLAGCITYFYVSGEGSAGEAGLMQPECQFVYDLDLTGRDDVVLRPHDDEVEGFEVMDVTEVERELALGHFKPNCAMVMLDFLIRHGILTPVREPNYIQLSSRLHRNLEFPLLTLAQAAS
jgi:8-oxo-dGTP pyrophosphatase MutT (NUDIX family)